MNATITCRLSTEKFAFLDTIDIFYCIYMQLGQEHSHYLPLELISVHPTILCTIVFEHTGHMV